MTEQNMEGFEPITNDTFPFIIDDDSMDAAQEILNEKARENLLNTRTIVETLATLPLSDEELAYSSFAFSSHNPEDQMMGVVVSQIGADPLYGLIKTIARHDSFANICTMLLEMAESRNHIVLHFMLLGQITHKDAKLFEVFTELRLIAGLEEMREQLVRKLKS